MNHLFELTVSDLDDALTVHSFKGEEKVSALFAFDVHVTTRSEEPLEKVILGKSAALCLRFGGLTRTILGLVGAATFEGASPESRSFQYC